MQQAGVPKVSFVSLGCPKALVDSERIITRLRAEGYELARKHDGADLVIVNTCGFLDSAKQESLAAIGQAMAENGQNQQNRGQGNSGRDPLGRPDRSNRPDLGLSVKVPDAIDIQRAREVLDEVRRRLGDPSRPPIELDYLERLIRAY